MISEGRLEHLEELIEENEKCEKRAPNEDLVQNSFSIVLAVASCAWGLALSHSDSTKPAFTYIMYVLAALSTIGSWLLYKESKRKNTERATKEGEISVKMRKITQKMRESRDVEALQGSSPESL